MLGHAAELMAKAELLTDGRASEKHLRGFGHDIDRLWRHETKLLARGQRIWSDVRTKNDVVQGVDFSNLFHLLSRLHDAPYGSRYGGVKRWPCPEPLITVFFALFDELENAHKK